MLGLQKGRKGCLHDNFQLYTEIHSYKNHYFTRHCYLNATLLPWKSLMPTQYIQMVYHCYQCHLPVEQYMIRQQRDSYMKHYVAVINNIIIINIKICGCY